MKAGIMGTIVLVLLAVILSSMTGCSKYDDRQPKPAFDIKSIKSYRDIPDITEEEVAAIEALKTHRQSFSYGLLLSSSGIELSSGDYAGFTPLLCELFSDLFGIPFVVQIHDWQQLKNKFDEYEIDFTGTINTTADLPNQYFKSSPITDNKLSVFYKDGEREIISEYDLRGLTVGFFSGSSTEEIVRKSFPYVDFKSTSINTSDEMAKKIQTGEIDAFIFDRPDVFSFYEFDHIAKAHSFPYRYVPVTITTANPQLAPVISVITKYLMAGGIDKVTKLSKIGEYEYASIIFKHSLTDEEKEYIANLSAKGEKIPVGFTNNRYPVAFFNEEANSYQGIAKDVLDEIGRLSCLDFEIAHDNTTIWRELENMLKEGEIKLLSQLIPNEARREYAIWPDTQYFSARYALLSNLNYPYLSLNQVPYVTVGLTAGTAEEAMYKLWFPDSEYKSYRTSDDGLTALEEGEIDLYFCLDYTLLYESNYRENAGQKVNILFSEPLEKVSFGLNINEEVLCSIISKAQKIINSERIVRNWTSRMLDLSSQMNKERVRYLTIMVICLVALLVVMFVSIIVYFKLSKANVESNRNFQSLLDMFPVGVRILSLNDWTLLYSNQACLDVFGCTSFEEQVEGQNGYKFMPEYQPDGRLTSEHLAEITKSNKAVAEIQCLKLSGEPFICRTTSRTINYAGHRASLAIMEDVTAEHKHKETLQNAVLREHEANQLKSRFLAMMSHEIRTPMNAILGITEIQLQNETLPVDTEEALGRIHDSGNLLLNIINDILDLSKIEAGKLEIIPVKYNIPSLINDVTQLNRMKYDDKPIEFSLEVDENTPINLFGDELRLRQVLNNILSNAFKYTEKGAVTLSVSSEAVPNNGKENMIIMIFKISDTGQGMSKEHLDRLFDEYTRFNLDSNRTTVGTGLGMSITKRILDLMDGNIIVESELDKGSVFTVRLPQKRIDSQVCTKETIEKLRDFRFNSTLMSKKSRILREYMPYGSVLVVDDVETNIYVTKGMLLPYGLKVDTASSGFEAIEKVKAGNEYDIIFMDHMMPKMDGLKATSLIRGLGYKNDIIALTANALVGQSEIFLKNGFDGYITKPIDSRELNHILNEFIRNKKPPEVVKAARKAQKEKGTEPIVKMPTQEEKLKEVKQFFLMDAQSAITVLENMDLTKMDDAQLDSYEITVHGMKSALANIGEKDLSAFALKLESAAKEKDFDIIQKETSALIEKLKELIQRITPKTIGRIRRSKELLSDEDAAFLNEKFLQIKAACETFDSNSAKNALEEIKNKKWPSEVDDYLDEVNVHLLHNAFKKAAAAIDAAMEFVK